MVDAVVFPAYAGMIRPRTRRLAEPEPAGGVPRLRGDDPSDGPDLLPDAPVFPAYAGMIRYGKVTAPETRVPRLRGDDPMVRRCMEFRAMCVPRLRGDDPDVWGPRVTKRECSPPTRG